MIFSLVSLFLLTSQLAAFSGTRSFVHQAPNVIGENTIILENFVHIYIVVFSGIFFVGNGQSYQRDQ